MKAVVTGGAGFVGSHVSERLAGIGYEVVVIDNLSRAELFGLSKPSDYNWKYLSTTKGVKLIQGDIRDFSTVKDIFRGAEFVVHTAAQTAVTTSLADPVMDFEINALGTVNVLEATRKYADDAATVFCSTNKVYGSNVNNIPVTKHGSRYSFRDAVTAIPPDFPTDNCEHSPYGCSKYAADLYVQDYGKVYGMNTAVFRMSCIYGTRQFGVSDQGWVSWFAIAMVTGNTITIYGDGKQVRDVLYIDDLVDAFLKFKQRGRAFRGEVFNMGGGKKNTVSLLELISLLEGLGAPKAKIMYSKWREADQKVYISDLTKAIKRLRWSPKVGVKEGVIRLFQWVVREKALFADNLA